MAYWNYEIGKYIAQQTKQNEKLSKDFCHQFGLDNDIVQVKEFTTLNNVHFNNIRGDINFTQYGFSVGKNYEYGLKF